MTSVTISGKTFDIGDRYSQGHALTENEASALNQLRRENIRNNMAKSVKDADEAGTFDQDAMQAQVTEYSDAYEFGQRTGGGATGDPVKREAMEMARQAIRKAIKEGGKKLSDYSAAQITAAAEAQLEKNPAYMAEAKKRIAAMQKQTVDGDLLEGLTPDTKKSDDAGEPASSTAE